MHQRYFNYFLGSLLLTIARLQSESREPRVKCDLFGTVRRLLRIAIFVLHYCVRHNKMKVSIDTDRSMWVFLYTFLYFLFFICRFLYQLDFLFCNGAFEQGHLDTWRYRNALIIIIIIYTIEIWR